MKAEIGSEDQELEASLSTVSPRIVAFAVLEHLFQFFRQTEIHDPTNQIFIRCLTNLSRSLKSLEALPGFESLEISFRGEQIYVNKMRMRPHIRQFRQTRHLVRFVRRRKLGALKFPPVVDPEVLRSFLWIVADVDSRDPNPLKTIRDKLQEKSIQGFEVDALKIGQGTALDGEASIADVDLVGVILHEKLRKNLEIIFENFENAKGFQLADLKDLLADLVHLEEEDLLQIFRVNLFKRTDRPFALMGVDAAFAITAWCRSIGLPPGVITDLARVALFHPLIYLSQKEVRISPMTAGEAKALLRLLGRLQSIVDFNEIEKLALFEWVQPFGDDGLYEIEGARCYAHFSSRMLRIIAAFKFLTQARPGYDVLLPDEAIAQLIREENQYDPTLLKLFVNWMGIYPVGTLVELQSGEVAQVFAAGSDPTRFQRPIVSVLKDAEGQLVDRPYLIDLMEMNEKLGVYRRGIKRSLRPDQAELPESIFKMAPLPLV